MEPLSGKELQFLEDCIDRLEQRRTQVMQEIRAYPGPIAGCDAQFNFLLEQRASISEQLNYLQHFVAAAPINDPASDPQSVFVQNNVFDAGETQKLIQICHKCLAKSTL